MRRIVGIALGIVGAVVVAGVAQSCGDSTAPGPKQYVATMLPGNELPPKTTTGTGITTFVDNGTQIDWTMSLTGMTGVFASHIHLGSATTASGPVIFNLFMPNGTNTSTLNGVVGSGTITNANNVTISLDSLRVLFNNGNAYVNVHTTANGGGEIRAQVLPK
jgi:hypothetical protein